MKLFSNVKNFMQEYKRRKKVLKEQEEKVNSDVLTLKPGSNELKNQVEVATKLSEQNKFWDKFIQIAAIVLQSAATIGSAWLVAKMNNNGLMERQLIGYRFDATDQIISSDTGRIAVNDAIRFRR